MSKRIFPIFEVDANKLISVHGNTAHFFKLTPPDLSQMSDLDTSRFFDGILQSLNGWDEDAYYKFYKLGKKSFLETNSSDIPHLHNVGISPSDEHLKAFFGESEIISNVEIEDDYILFNGVYTKILSAISFSDEAINFPPLPIDADYIVFLKKIDPNKSLKKMDFIRTKHLTGFFKKKRDLSSEGAYQQAENLMRDLISGQDSLYEFQLFFLIKGESLAEANEELKQLQKILKLQGIKLYLEGNSFLRGKSGLYDIFNELIPGVKPEINLRTLPNRAAHLRYLLPLNNSFLMDGGMLFHDQNDQEIFFDPFNENLKNRNMLITGSSGAGKSVFVNKLVHNMAAEHPHGDPGQGRLL